MSQLSLKYDFLSLPFSEPARRNKWHREIFMSLISASHLCLPLHSSNDKQVEMRLLLSLSNKS